VPVGLPLGVDPRLGRTSGLVDLDPGDALLLFTDGLVERRADSISDALREFTAAAVPAGPDAGSHADRILGNAVSDTGDDACLVAVRIL
jgi:serine phosphatase RsbU (regulator of sigma subunit)